jgi:SAM-dependent methyltransferase
MVYELLLGLWAPGMIEAGWELGLYEALAEGPRSSADLAGELALRPHATAVLLEGLAAYGLLSIDTGWGPPRYALRDEVAAVLLPNSLFSLTGKIAYDRNRAWHAWHSLAETVRRGPDGGQPNQISAQEYQDLAPGINFWAPPVVRAVLAGVAAVDRVQPNGLRLLDVGCGTGIYSHLLLREQPSWTAVGLDAAPLAELAARQAERMGVADRFTFKAADFHQDHLGSDVDVALFVNIFHLQTPELASGLLANAAKCLADDGLVVIVDQIVDPAREPSPQNTFAKLFAVSMLATGGGGCYSTTDYDEWLSKNGLRRVALVDAPMHRVLFAKNA